MHLKGRELIIVSAIIFSFILISLIAFPMIYTNIQTNASLSEFFKKIITYISFIKAKFMDILENYILSAIQTNNELIKNNIYLMQLQIKLYVMLLCSILMLSILYILLILGKKKIFSLSIMTILIAITLYSLALIHIETSIHTFYLLIYLHSFIICIGFVTIISGILFRIMKLHKLYDRISAFVVLFNMTLLIVFIIFLFLQSPILSYLYNFIKQSTSSLKALYQTLSNMFAIDLSLIIDFILILYFMYNYNPMQNNKDNVSFPIIVHLLVLPFLGGFIKYIALIIIIYVYAHFGILSELPNPNLYLPFLTGFISGILVYPIYMACYGYSSILDMIGTGANIQRMKTIRKLIVDFISQQIKITGLSNKSIDRSSGYTQRDRSVSAIRPSSISYNVVWGADTFNKVIKTGTSLSSISRVYAHHDKNIGSGGEGAIYLLLDEYGEPIMINYNNVPVKLCAKIYHKRTDLDEIMEKIDLMLRNKPREPQRDHISFAWPLGMLYDENRRFAGYVMPLVQGVITLNDILITEDIQWITRLNESLDEYMSELKTIYPQTSEIRRYVERIEKFLKRIKVLRATSPTDPMYKLYVNMIKLLVARNIAAIIANLHEKGYIVGDINDNNFLVSLDGLVTLIDTDSLAVKDPSSGKVYPCRVGVPEYQAPEVLRGEVSFENRNEYTDRFSLAILLFKILMKGFNPFQGIPVDSKEENITPDKNIMKCVSGFFEPDKVRLPTGAPNIKVLEEISKDLVEMFRRALIDGCKDPEKRPSAKEWVEVFDKIIKRITSLLKI